MLKRIVAILVLVILAGCGGKEYKEVIVGKKFIDGYMWFMPLPAGNSIILMPQTVSDEWHVFTENHNVTVTRETYELAEVGDTLIVTKNKMYLKKHYD